MSAKTVTLRNSFDDTESDVAVMRAFQISDEDGLILTGNDYDDHEIWLLHNDSAELLGTLTEDAYKHLRRTKNLLLFVGDSTFAWLRDELPEGRLHSNISGKYVSSTLLRSAYTYTQALKK